MIQRALFLTTLPACFVLGASLAATSCASNTAAQASAPPPPTGNAATGNAATGNAATGNAATGNAATTSTADPLIGLESTDWMLSPVGGFEAFGERILKESAESGLGLALGRSDSGQTLVLDRRLSPRPGVVVFRIEAVLRFAPSVPDDAVAWDGCVVDQTPRDQVVAILDAPPGLDCAVAPLAPATAAWAVSNDGNAFVPLAP